MIILGYIFIFCAKLIEVTCFTFRTLALMRGKRAVAAIIGFVEVIVWVTALGKVMSALNDLTSIIIYAAGFAVGNYFGSVLEEKIALGILSVQVILDKGNEELIETIRETGFGVTVLEAKGRDSEKEVLYIVLKRKELNKLQEIITSSSSSPVISITDARALYGGVLKSIKGNGLFIK